MKSSVKRPLKENLDFGSRAKAVTSNYMMPFSNSFIPRTPVGVLKSSSKEKKNFSPMNSFKMAAAMTIGKDFTEKSQACPCCKQFLPPDMKLVNLAQTKEDTSPSSEMSKKKGRKRKNKGQV